MKRQNGAILAVCLVFLALIALMAAAGMESVLLHQRMEANMRRFHNGFEAAEAALREAEAMVDRRCPDSIQSEPPIDQSPWPQIVQLEPQWWETHGLVAEIAGDTNESPRYFLETWDGHIIPPDGITPFYYRVTARGPARSAAGSSVLQVLGSATCSGADTMARTRLSWRQLI